MSRRAFRHLTNQDLVDELKRRCPEVIVVLGDGKNSAIQTQGSVRWAIGVCKTLQERGLAAIKKAAASS